MNGRPLVARPIQSDTALTFELFTNLYSFFFEEQSFSKPVQGRDHLVLFVYTSVTTNLPYPDKLLTPAPRFDLFPAT